MELDIVRYITLTIHCKQENKIIYTTRWTTRHPTIVTLEDGTHRKEIILYFLNIYTIH